MTRLRFDEFVFDDEQRMLSHDGAALRLTPKAIHLLEILLRDRPRAVPKRELLSEIWPDVVVEEANLTNLVSELRGALGDDARSPRYIRTAHGHGYSFVGDARGVPDAEAPPAAFERPRPRRRYLLLMLIAGLVATGVLLAVGTGFSRAARSRGQAAVRFEPLRTSEMSGWSALSPDGRFLAYATVGRPRKTIRLRNLATESEVELLPPLDVNGFFKLRFSRDGNLLYYIQGPLAGGGSELRVVSVLGGPSTRVTGVSDAVQVQGFDVAPDGRTIAWIESRRLENITSVIIDDGRARREVWRVTPRLLVSSTVVWSPRGDSLIVLLEKGADPRGRFNFAEIELATGRARFFAPRSRGSVYSMSWSSDGSALLATTDDGKLVRISVPAGEIVTLPSPPDWRLLWVFPAADHRIFAIAADTQANLWIDDLERNESRRISFVPREMSGARSVAWTTDDQIVFSARERIDGKTSLWTCDSAGEHRRRLTHSPAGRLHGYADVSPDGQWIVFCESNLDGTRTRIALFDRTRDTMSYLPGEYEYFVWPFFAPDGRSIIFTRWRNGEPRAAQLAMDTNAITELPLPSECMTHAVDRTRKLLLCGDRVGRELVFSLDGSPVWRGNLRAVAPLQFAPDGSISYTSALSDNVGKLWSSALDERPPRQLNSYTSENIFTHAWAPTGQRLVTSRGTQSFQPMLITLDGG